MEVELEDRDRASQFRIDLRNVSLLSNAPASSFPAFTTALSENETVSKNRRLRCANVQPYKITSTLDVLDSRFEPMSQSSSSFPKSSHDRVSLTPSISYTSDDSYWPGRSSSHSSSDTDHPTVSEKPIRSAPRSFPKLEMQYFGYKPTAKTILAVQNSALKRRCSEEDETAAAHRSAPSKKMRYKNIDTLSPASLLVRRPQTVWQDVEVTINQAAASSMDHLWPKEPRRALSFRRRL